MKGNGRSRSPGESLSPILAWPSASYERLSAGLIPQAMEDKWFIFLEGDDIYFHRSWTGVCIYQVRLVTSGERHSVAEAYANRDPSQYVGTDDGYDVRLLRFLIDNLLSGKDHPSPKPADLPKSVPEGAYQHHVAGTGYREVEVPGRRGKGGRLWRWLTRR